MIRISNNCETISNRLTFGYLESHNKNNNKNREEISEEGMSDNFPKLMEDVNVWT